MADVYIGLGANLGDPADNLRQAVRRLAERIDVRAVSSLYRTEPVGVRDQPYFLNAALRAETDMRPCDLIHLFIAIEEEMGRVREVPMGPRALDLDLLLHGDVVVSEPGVDVPHPRMTERRFVLEPLVEIAPDVVHPVLGVTVAELLKALTAPDTVERIAAGDWVNAGD